MRLDVDQSSTVLLMNVSGPTTIVVEQIQDARKSSSMVRSHFTYLNGSPFRMDRYESVKSHHSGCMAEVITQDQQASADGVFRECDSVEYWIRSTIPVQS